MIIVTVTAFQPFRNGEGQILSMREWETDRFRRDRKIKDLRTYFAAYYTFNTFEAPGLRVDWVTDQFGICMWFEERTAPPAPQSGYTPCACRDCMDTTVSSDTSKPELCADCKHAECVPWPGEIELNEFENYECQRGDAYGEA